jgi:hypothetical protein
MNKLINFRTDEITRKKFHIWCIHNGTSAGEVLREHINGILDECEPPIRYEPKTGWLSANNHSNGVPVRWEGTY